MMDILYDGKCDLGFERKFQEDAIEFEELDENTKLFIICDGSGMQENELNPGDVVAVEIKKSIKRQFDEDPEFVKENAELVLKEAFNLANRVIGAFKSANDEIFDGYMASATVCLIYENNFTFAHTGNTRLYLLRNSKKQGGLIFNQLTRDFTKSYEAYRKGDINMNQYYTHSDRLLLTNCIGYLNDIEVQTFTGVLKVGDIIIMTTDGIHYAINPQAMEEIIIKSENTEKAIDNLIFAAKTMKYRDNMSAIVIFTIN